VNRLKVMPLDQKPGEVVNDHEAALIGEAEAEEGAEEEVEAEDEAEAITNLNLLQKSRPRLKTKSNQRSSFLSR
jgi:hypothetical protein